MVWTVVAIVLVVGGALMMLKYRRVGDSFYYWRYRIFGKMGAPDELFSDPDQRATWRFSAFGLGLALVVIGIIDLARILGT